MEVRARTRRQDRATVILEAASAVLRRGGSRALTIEAVAAEAGLSKGGVLHHYASKDALILAMVAHKLTTLSAEIAACEAAQPPGPGALPRAIVAHARAACREEEEFSRALLLASVENPQALEGYRALIGRQLARLATVEDRPGAGAALLLAILGLFIGRTLGFHDLGQAETEHMLNALDAGAATFRGEAQPAPEPATHGA